MEDWLVEFEVSKEDINTDLKGEIGCLIILLFWSAY